MKFADKLTLALTLLLAALMTAYSIWTLDRQFTADLRAAAEQAQTAWQQERYAMQTGLESRAGLLPWAASYQSSHGGQPLLLGVFVSIKWMLAGSVVTSFVAYFLNSYYSADLVGYPTREQITDWLPTFLVSLLVSAAMWSLSLTALPYPLLLPLQCVAGLALAILIYERLRLPEYMEVRQLALSAFRRLGGRKRA